MIYYKDSEIIIRDLEQQDSTYLFCWWVDKELNQYDPRPIPSNSRELLMECTRFCDTFETQKLNDNIELRKYKYFMITNQEHHPIGLVNFFSIDKDRGQGELGVIIGDKRYWQKGIAYKSINVAVQYIFENMDISRIYIETGETNTPALKLFSKLGFVCCDEYLEDSFKFIVMEKLR